MKHRLYMGAMLLLLCIFSTAFAQQTYQAIVVGDQLSWEGNSLSMTLLVTEQADVTIGMYSPGFDPDDYRAELRGGTELGDERYDEGMGTLRSDFSLLQGNKVLANKTYGVEAHRNDILFQGVLAPGEYVLQSSFFGKAKNAFNYSIGANPQRAISLFIEPYQAVVNPSHTNYNVHRGDWQVPFRMRNNTGEPMRIGIFDGDGSFELDFRLGKPDGSWETQPVSGDLQWMDYSLAQQGNYEFNFKVPEGAYQYTNTIAMRSDCRLQVEANSFSCVRPAAFSIDKTVTPSQAMRGESVRYSMRVSNIGGTWGTVRVDDFLPQGLVGNNLQETLSLHPGQSQELSILAAVDANAPEYIVNTASVSAISGSSSASAALYVSSPTAPVAAPQVAAPAAPAPQVVYIEVPSAPEVVYVETPGETVYVETPGETVYVETPGETVYVEVEKPIYIQAPALPAPTPEVVYVEVEKPVYIETPVYIELPAEQVVVTKTEYVNVEVPVIKYVEVPVPSEPITQIVYRDAPVQAAPPAAPAEFTLTKSVDKSVATVGEAVSFEMVVTNIGGSAGEFSFRDILPTGLNKVNDILDTATLAAGKSKRYRLYTEINDEAPEVIENCAVLSSRMASNITACASIVVQRPVQTVQMMLLKEASPTAVQVGETVNFTLTAKNMSAQAQEFTIEDNLPDYLEGSNFTETFTLNAGETRSFRVSARVADNAPEVIVNAATLSSGGNSATATAPVYVFAPAPVVVAPAPPAPPVPAPTPAPTPVVVEPTPPAPASFSIAKIAVQGTAQVGSVVDFVIGIKNTGASVGMVNLTDILPAGLDGINLSTEVELAPNEERSFPVSATVREDAPDIIVNNACITSINGEQCAMAQVRVIRPVARPDFKQLRFSEIILNYGTEAINTALAASVLVGHVPPTGSSYAPGSSFFNGNPIADPIVDDQGRLLWLVDNTQGQVSYGVQHEGSLPPVAEPSVTLRTADREIRLLGDVSFDILDQLGLNQQAMMPTKYVGDIALIPYQINVGNREHVDLGIVLPAEVSMEHDYITIAANLDFVDPDAEPLISGYQVVLDEHGEARIRFEPQTTVKQLELELAYGDVLRTTDLTLLGADSAFYHYHVSVTARLLGDDIAANGFGQGYAEIPFAGGTFQAALDVGANYAKDDTDAYGFNIDTDRGLVSRQTPIERFQLTGSGQEAQGTLRSDDGIAARYDSEAMSIGYYGGGTNVPGLNGGPDMTAARIETHGDFKVSGFAAMVADSARSITYDKEGKDGNGRLDGTRTYLIGEPVARSSERVIITTVTGEEVLTRFEDYTLDYQTGLLTLAKPQWYVDENYNPVTMRVDYAPANAARDKVAYGAGVVYNSGDFRFGVGAMDLQGPDGLEVGAQATYEADTFGVNLAYHAKVAAEGLKDSTYSINTWGNGDFNPFEARAEMTFTDKGLQGKGRVGYSIFDTGTIALEHQGSQDTHGAVSNRSDVLYEQRFGDFGIGAGLGYGWEQEVLNGIVRGLYSTDALDINVTHAQPFQGDTNATTNLDSSIRIDENLSLNTGLNYDWGNELQGVVGLDQRLGDANLSVDYQLPTASGDGNRARFGLDVPLPISENLDLDLSAGYEYKFGVGQKQLAFGSGLRYHTESLNATVGAEVSIPESGDTKVSIRTGATGQLGRDQTISADVNYQVMPTMTGRASLSYALKMQRLTLLTYHTLTNSENENILKGEVSPTFHWADSVQIRPSFAYRMDFNDPQADTYQLSLGGTYLFGLDVGDWDPTLGLGAYGHYIWQPGTGEDALGASIELMAKVLDPLWLTIGYTYTDLPGVTTLTEGGLYFGISLHDGGQF